MAKYMSFDEFIKLYQANAPKIKEMYEENYKHLKPAEEDSKEKENRRSVIGEAVSSGLLTVSECNELATEEIPTEMAKRTTAKYAA